MIELSLELRTFAMILTLSIILPTQLFIWSPQKPYEVRSNTVFPSENLDNLRKKASVIISNMLCSENR